jgi:23S rRNA pseudouridine1911/1915/1917 synthase
MPTLLEILQQRFPASSTTTLRKMLKSDRVTVNGVTIRDAKVQIAPDDVVESGNSTRRNRIDSRLKIVFEDSDLIVVEKPTELLTVASPTEKRNTVEALLDSYFNAAPGEHRVHVVQRLDRDTSGVLVFARNAFAREVLEEQFAAHDVGRTYVAIVRGQLQPPSGTFRSFLAEDSEMRVRSIADIAKGKEAITHYRTIASGAQYSMLEINLETGRRNQIRVHLSEAGHPVAGDTMYGGHEDARALNRLALHARDLAFLHPRTKEEMKFTSPLPDLLAAFKL